MLYIVEVLSYLNSCSLVDFDGVASYGDFSDKANRCTEPKAQLQLQHKSDEIDYKQ